MHCYRCGWEHCSIPHEEVLAKVAERKRHIELASAASSRNQASVQGPAECRSNAGVSILQRGKSSASLGEPSCAASSAASVISDSASPAKGKHLLLAAGYIKKLPLSSLLNGTALGRSTGPALAKMKECVNHADPQMQLQGDLLRDYLDKCTHAVNLASRLSELDDEQLTVALTAMDQCGEELPTPIKNQVVKRRVAALRKKKQYVQMLKVASPWQFCGHESTDFDSLSPAYCMVEGSSHDKAMIYATMLVEEVLLPMVKEGEAGVKSVESFCSSALASFDEISSEVSDDYDQVIVKLAVLFRAFLGLVSPIPGREGSQATDVKGLLIDSFVQPLNVDAPWMMAMAAGLKADKYWNALQKNYLDTCKDLK